jgi:hypothetical protein
MAMDAAPTSLVNVSIITARRQRIIRRIIRCVGLLEHQRGNPPTGNLIKDRIKGAFCGIHTRHIR